jgi:hypothetical protein
MGVVGITSHYTFNPNTFLRVTLAAMGQHSSTRVDTLGFDLAKFQFFQNSMTDNRLSASAIMNHRFNSPVTLSRGELHQRRYTATLLTAFTTSRRKITGSSLIITVQPGYSSHIFNISSVRETGLL